MLMTIDGSISCDFQFVNFLSIAAHRIHHLGVPWRSREWQELAVYLHELGWLANKNTQSICRNASVSDVSCLLAARRLSAITQTGLAVRQREPTGYGIFI
jgi:hypothetical protein